MLEALLPAGSWPHAIIFDLDGTLVDSAPDIAVAVNRALAESAIEIDADQARRYLGDGARKLIARALKAHDRPIDEARLTQLTERFNACYHEHPCADSRLYPGVEEALTRLKAGGVALAICTNKPQLIADQVATRLRLNHYIDTIVGAGRYALKPDPEPLRACLGELGCDPVNALYIGDMAVDRDAGRAAGLKVLIAAFGYSARPAAELDADGVLTGWSSLDSAIAGLTVKY